MIIKRNKKPEVIRIKGEELKRCPFCGGNNLANGGHYIQCDDCGAHGPENYPVPDEMTEKLWNTRNFAQNRLTREEILTVIRKNVPEKYWPIDLWYEKLATAIIERMGE